MIHRIQEYTIYNPIRDHLRISVDTTPREKRLDEIIKRLQAGNFDPLMSRALVFVPTRRSTEQLTEAFNESDSSWQAEFFHAGMAGEEREAIYRSYRNGRVSILFATKAFGMGMDIPNIHFIFHVEPPTSLEDYLQEIGRGGRDPHQFRRAGFSQERPIQCVLFTTETDFSNLRDRMHKNQLSWRELSLLQQMIHEFIQRFQSFEAQKLIPLPIDFLEKSSEFAGKPDLMTRQRLILYWLEKLERIRLGVYLPAHLEFENQPCLPPPSTVSAEVGKLCEAIENARQNSPQDAERISVSTIYLFQRIGVSTFRDLFKIIVEAEKANYIKLYRHVHSKPTKLRFHEVEYMIQTTESSPILDAAYAFAKTIVPAAIGDARVIDEDFLEETRREFFEPFYRTENWKWIDDEERRERQLEKDKEDFAKPNRVKTLFRLINSIPQIYIKTEMTEQAVRHVIRNDNRRWREWLDQHSKIARTLLKEIYNNHLTGGKLDLIPMLQLVPEGDIDRLENVLIFLKGLGYIHYSGPLIPMAIELTLLKTNSIDTSNRESDDYKVYEDFEENKRLRELRLAALETLSLLPDESQQDAFICQYFESTEDSQTMRELIEEYLPAEHSLREALRAEALKRLVYGKQAPDEAGEPQGGLNDEQLAVYNAPFEESVCVIAGPGSGKTHTLLLRIAHLLHEEKVDPESIIVIAYNRAVVSELKHRLQDLFRALGYRHLIRRLRVLTFHGLIKSCIPDRLDGWELNEWEDSFIAAINKSLGLIQDRLGTIDYLFVDEFQDMTRNRYKILKFIAPPGKCSVTVIGDPNQSIYGHERKNDGEPMGAEPYFSRFKEDYAISVDYELRTNYRSYEQIIRTAERVIEPTLGKLLSTSLDAERKPRENWSSISNYVEEIEASSGLTVEKIRQLLTDKKSDGKPYRDVALLFRTNKEVYRAIGRIREEIDLDAVKIRVQGESSQFTRLREVAHFIDTFREREDEVIADDFVEAFEADRGTCPPNWHTDHFDMLQGLLWEYGRTRPAQATYGNLAEFLQEVTQRGDGQIYRIYQFWKDQAHSTEHGRHELVLSTIHKVKGLEFDAVIIPASSVSLPFAANFNSPSELEDLMAEERRIYYVGMTRAKERLIWIKSRREAALIERQHYGGAPDSGIGFESGMQNTQISRCANANFIRHRAGFSSEQEYFNYVADFVRVGDAIQLWRDGGQWFVMHSTRKVAVLSGAAAESLAVGANSYVGLEVTNVVRYTYQESLNYDEKHGTRFSESWSDYFKEQGWTYLVEFSGYTRANGEG